MRSGTAADTSRKSECSISSVVLFCISLLLALSNYFSAVLWYGVARDNDVAASWRLESPAVPARLTAAGEKLKVRTVR